PPFTHFVTVLFVACLMLIPSMTPPVLGVAIVTVTALRTVALVGIFRRMREAHERFGDIELSDWLMGILVPLACYLGLLASAGSRGVSCAARRKNGLSHSFISVSTSSPPASAACCIRRARLGVAK